MRHTAEAHEWLDQVQGEGARAAIERRDAPFGDYSQAPKDEQPDPRNVIVVKSRSSS